MSNDAQYAEDNQQEDEFYPDPFGQDRFATLLTAIALVTAVFVTWWSHGFSTAPYRWADGGLLPLWADLLLTILIVPVVAYGFFIVLAAVLRLESEQERGTQ